MSAPFAGGSAGVPRWTANFVFTMGWMQRVAKKARIMVEKKVGMVGGRIIAIDAPVEIHAMLSIPALAVMASLEGAGNGVCLDGDEWIPR